MFLFSFLFVLEPFKNLSTRAKQILIFSWLVGIELARDTVNQNSFIEKDDITPFVKMKNKDSFRDSSVDLEILKDLVSDEVYKVIEEYQVMSRQGKNWICGGCRRKVAHGISCDRCHQWFHFKCSGLKNAQNIGSDDIWICKDCTQNYEIGIDLYCILL